MVNVSESISAAKSGLPRAAQVMCSTQSRRSFLRLAGAASFALAGTGLLVACGGDAEEGQPGPGTGSTSGTGETAAASTPATGQSSSPAAGSATTATTAEKIVVGLAAAGLSKDPAKTTALEDWVKIQNLYNGLLRYRPGGFELEPDLAERWEVSGDGMQIDFTLKSGIQFHKGFGEFTADDVKFSIERQMDPNFKSFNSADLVDVDTVEAVDPYHVKFTLNKVSVPFLSVLAFGRPMTGAIVSKAAAEQLGNDNYDEHPIGTGPFVFESEIPNQSWTFVRNDDYYEGPASVVRVEMRNIADEPTLALAIEAGEVHLGQLNDIDLIKKYEDGTKAQIFRSERTAIDVIELNTTLEPLSDVRVRRALALAVNTEELVTGILGGFGERPSRGLFHPKMLGYDASFEPWPYDPEQARQMLTEAGADGLTLNTVTYPGSSWGTLGALLQQQFAQAGVTFVLEQVERGALTQRRAAPDQPASIVAGFGTKPDPNSLLTFFEKEQLPPGGLNLCRYVDADALIKQQREALDEEQRKSILVEIQRKFAEDVPVIPIWHKNIVMMGAKNVKEYVIDPNGGQWLHRVVLG